MQQLNPAQKEQLQRQLERRKKSIAVAYFLWFIIMAHHAYLGKWPTQILFWLTLGGVYIWWIVDGIRMQTLINNHNDALEERLTMQILKTPAQQLNTPERPQVPIMLAFASCPGAVFLAAFIFAQASAMDTVASPPRKAKQPLPSFIFALALALVGGVFGIVGAFIGEARIWFPDPFLTVPIIEEIVKPFGIYLMLERWPQLLRGRAHTAFLAACGGLVFGLLESVVYVMVYVDDPSPAFVAYRFSVPVALHAVSSGIFGMGLDERLLKSVKRQGSFPWDRAKYFAAAIALHSAYNRIVTIVALAIQPLEAFRRTYTFL